MGIMNGETKVVTAMEETYVPSETNVCVIGLGYIGLPTASVLATKGFHVYGTDVRAVVSIVAEEQIQGASKSTLIGGFAEGAAGIEGGTVKD